MTILSHEFLKPTIELSGPSIVYLLCDKGNITFENTLDSIDYEYEWVVHPSINDIDMLLNLVKESKLEIPLSYFKEGKIEITC